MWWYIYLNWSASLGVVLSASIGYFVSSFFLSSVVLSWYFGKYYFLSLVLSTEKIWNWRLQLILNSGGLGGNKELNFVWCTQSSCDTSTDTEKSSWFSTYFIIIASLILFFISFDILFLLFLLHSLIII